MCVYIYIYVYIYTESGSTSSCTKVEPRNLIVQIVEPRKLTYLALVFAFPSPSVLPSVVPDAALFCLVLPYCAFCLGAAMCRMTGRYTKVEPRNLTVHILEPVV